MSESMTTAPRALERTKVKPILFSGPMVRALIDGRKAMTRRILKPQPPPECSIHYMLGNESWLPENRRTPLRHSWEAWRGPLYDARPAKALAGGFEVRMPWTPGDFLWVREHWRTEARFDDLPPREIPQSAPIIFEADYQRGQDDECRGRFRPGMFLPRWASRLTLEVTAVKVEKLQEISEEDAIAEGIETDQSGLFLPVAWRNYAYDNHPFKSAAASFRSLWDSLNAKRGYGWEENPWVCAIAFRVHKMNVDAFLVQREAA